jgi:hypothetical protein
MAEMQVLGGDGGGAEGGHDHAPYTQVTREYGLRINQYRLM